MTVQSIKCPKCSTELSEDLLNATDQRTCPECKRLLLVKVFPAFRREMPKGKVGERLGTESEASCFFHSSKRALVSCDGCGRFLCGLCDLEVNNKHLCPPCLEAGAKKGRISDLESERLDYNHLVFYVALLPLIAWPITLVTAPAALYMGVRHWNSPRSLVTESRFLMVFGMIFGAFEVMAWAAGLIALFNAAPWSGK